MRGKEIKLVFQRVAERNMSDIMGQRIQSGCQSQVIVYLVPFLILYGAENLLDPGNAPDRVGEPVVLSTIIDAISKAQLLDRPQTIHLLCSQYLPLIVAQSNITINRIAAYVWIAQPGLTTHQTHPAIPGQLKERFHLPGSFLRAGAVTVVYLQKVGDNSAHSRRRMRVFFYDRNWNCR